MAVDREGEGEGWRFVAALVAITLIGPLTIHMYLPALPDIRRDFAVATGAAQLTFSIGLLAMAAATLAFGALSDRLGRRPVLLSGLGLFTLGAVLCTVAPDIEALAAGRALQGTGAACGVVSARSIVRDVYGVDRLAQMIAYLTAAYVLGPMFAPPIGGALVDGFGWRALAGFAAVLGAAIVVLAWSQLRETRPPHLAAANRLGLVAGHRRLLGSLRFCCYALQPGLATGAFFAHGAGAAYLMAEVLQRPASEFGLYFAFGPAGFMLGNFLTGRYGARLPRELMMVSGSLVAVGAVALLSVFATLGGMTPFKLFLPAFFVTLGQGLSMPHAQAAAIATDERLTGTASGIVVFLQFFFAAVLSQLVGLLADGTYLPMIAVMLAGSALSLISAVVPVALDRRRAGAAD